MRSDGIVVTSPVLDQDFRLTQRREDLAVEKLVSQLRVQALAVAVLPWTSRFDVERLDADPAEPVTNVARDELRAVIGANVLRRPVGDEEIGQTLEHVVGSKPSRNDNRQAPARELIQYDQHAEGAAVLRAVLNKVVRPDVIDPLGSVPNAAVLTAARQTASPLLFPRDLHLFLLPQSMDSFVVHLPPLG